MTAERQSGAIDGGPVKFEEFWERQALYPGASQAVFSDVRFNTPGLEGLCLKLVSFPDEQAALLRLPRGLGWQPISARPDGRIRRSAPLAC
jgi:hypothetical protein